MEKLGLVLAELAQKLNTTADKLWSTLVAQASVYAWFNIAQAIGLIIAVVLYVVIVLRLIKNKIRTFTKVDHYSEKQSTVTTYRNWYDHQANDRGNEVVAVISAIATVIFGIILLIMTLTFATSGLYDVVTALVNPEYWALKQIMRLVN